MGKNFRWIASIIAFVAVGIVVGGGINDILRIKVGSETDMIHSFYDLEEDSLDVLFLGSSHCYHAIQPNTLWGEYGIPSYVLGSPGQTIPCSYYLLKEALRYQHPKVVMLETYTFRDTEKYRGDARLRQAVNGIRLGEVKREIVEDFFPDLPWKDKLSYYFPFLMDHSRWSDLDNSDFNQNPYLKGGILYFKRISQEEPEIPKDGAELPDLTQEYLEKIRRLCDEKGIELVLFAAPFGYCGAYGQAQPINVTLETYCAEKGIPFLFYQKISDVGIDYNADFYDLQHLNSFGTEKLTRHLGGWLRDRYSLKDRRSQKEYRIWNEDYEDYLEAFAKGSKSQE